MRPSKRHNVAGLGAFPLAGDPPSPRHLRLQAAEGGELPRLPLLDPHALGPPGSRSHADCWARGSPLEGKTDWTGLAGLVAAACRAWLVTGGAGAVPSAMPRHVSFAGAQGAVRCAQSQSSKGRQITYADNNFEKIIKIFIDNIWRAVVDAACARHRGKLTKLDTQPF